jgi:hypothetical protein
MFGFFVRHVSEQSRLNAIAAVGNENCRVTGSAWKQIPSRVMRGIAATPWVFSPIVRLRLRHQD